GSIQTGQRRVGAAVDFVELLCRTSGSVGRGHRAASKSHARKGEGHCRQGGAAQLALCRNHGTLLLLFTVSPLYLPRSLQTVHTSNTNLPIATSQCAGVW